MSLSLSLPIVFALTFDWTLSVSNLVGMAFIILSAYGALHLRLTRIETKIDPMWQWFTGQVPDVRQPRRRRHVVLAPGDRASAEAATAAASGSD